jgi:hypothetical protein
MLTAHVLGLQRTGTNYLAALLKDNLAIDVVPSGDRSICWKHALPREATPHKRSAAEGVMNNPEVFIYIISKHPLHWVASVTMRNPQDLFLKRPTLMTDMKPDIASLCRLYTTFYSNWINLLSSRGRFVLVRYEELLSKPLACIENFATVMGLNSPQSIQATGGIPYSRRKSSEELANYLTGRHGLPDHLVATIIDCFDKNFLERMGYAEDPPVINRL